MAKKHEDFYDDIVDDEDVDDEDVDDEDVDDEDVDDEKVDDEKVDDEKVDDDDEDDEEVEENEEEMEEIESKLASGEEFVAPHSEVAMLLKANIIYSCPRCRKIYFKDKWIKDNITDIYTVRTELAYCDKCIGKTAENFIGSIEIYDKKLSEKKNALFKLVKKVEGELENKQPFEGVIDILEKSEILYVFTNTTRLAVEIAREIRHEWHGAMQYEWFERNQFLRAKWFSEVQNREYFKSRIRAAKEKRIGMFSFEEEQ
jgi:hypothetical protein